jgi:hypothetical protein
MNNNNKFISGEAVIIGCENEFMCFLDQIIYITGFITIIYLGFKGVKYLYSKFSNNVK